MAAIKDKMVAALAEAAGDSEWSVEREESDRRMVEEGTLEVCKRSLVNSWFICFM